MFSVSPLIVGYSVHEPRKDKSILLSRKLVVFTQEENGMKQEVLVKGVQIVHDACDHPASLLGQVDALSVCSWAAPRGIPICNQQQEVRGHWHPNIQFKMPGNCTREKNNAFHVSTSGKAS